MSHDRDTRISKLLILVLRHQPEHLGLALDSEGYVDVRALLDALARHPQPLTREELDRIVQSNDKQRFTFDTTRSRIRASQGHSVAVDLGYAEHPPPPTLY